MINGVAACEKTAMMHSVRMKMRDFMVQCVSCNVVVLEGGRERGTRLASDLGQLFFYDHGTGTLRQTTGRSQLLLFIG